MKDFKKQIGFINVLLIVVSLVMLFIAPSLKREILNSNFEVDVSAFNVIFGIEDAFKFNVLGFIAIILLVGSAILPFLKVDKKLKHLITALALIISGVLLFVFPSTIQIVAGSFSAEVSFMPAWPIIVSGVLAIVAAVLNLFNVVA